MMIWPFQQIINKEPRYNLTTFFLCTINNLQPNTIVLRWPHLLLNRSFIDETHYQPVSLLSTLSDVMLTTVQLIYHNVACYRIPGKKWYCLLLEACLVVKQVMGIQLWTFYYAGQRKSHLSISCQIRWKTNASDRHTYALTNKDAILDRLGNYTTPGFAK